VLVTLSILGTLTVGTVVIAPRYIVAGPPPPQEFPAAMPAHQQLIEDLGGLIERSVGVLAIHDRGSTPYVEMVLWLTDHPEIGIDGKADDGELAVLSHSSILQTISIYRMTSDGKDAAAAIEASRSSSEFCRQWRANSNVVPLVLASGVSDVRVEPAGGAQDEWVAWGPWGGLQRLRLTLTWAVDSADGPDEASVLVHTVMFPIGAGKETNRTWEASEKLLGDATVRGARSPRRDVTVDAVGQR
jgi:hypothetical protein